MTEPTTSRPSGGDIPPNIPGCELLRRIGRGSYGDVWLARDSSGEFRAVKVVYRKTFEHDRPFERELSGIQKFEPISRSHASQVSILQVGRNLEAGFFYYVMELADDATWDTNQHSEASSDALPLGKSFIETYVPKTLKNVLTRRGHLSFRECLEVGLALATALEHLHSCGLIHRDIKPSNVIFVDGVPKLADIGLVTDAGGTISFVGTEGFLPPEGPGTPPADIYSLGKVLYEMSTGRDRMEFPELPTFVGEPAERESILEVNQIFLRACQNDVRKRYQSAREMAHDLELLRSGRSVRQARATERRLAKARILTAVAIVLIAAIWGVDHWLQQRRVRQVEAEKAQREHDARLASKVATDKSRQLARLYMSSGRALEKQGDLYGAAVWYAKAQAGGAGTPGDPEDLVSPLLKQVPTLAFLSVHTGGVHSVAQDANDQRIATAGQDGMVRLWRNDTGELLGQPLPHPQPVQQAWLSPDGERVLSIDRAGVARLWKGLTKLHVTSTLEQSGAVFAGAFRFDSRQLLTISANEALLRETSGERVRFTFKPTGPITAGLFSPDGQVVALGSQSGHVQLWNTETGQPVVQLQASSKPVHQLCFSPNSMRIAVVSGQELRLWNVGTGEPAAFTCRQEGAIHNVAFSPDGRRIASAGEDRSVRIWETISGRLAGQPLPHDEPVTAVAFNPDGLQLASASGNEVHLWELRTGARQLPLLIHNGPVSSVRFSREGHSLFTASADGTAREYRLEGPGENPASSSGDARPNGEWVELMAGRHVSTEEQLVPLTASEMGQRWTTHRRKMARHFDFSKWHQGRAKTCEDAGEWFAAAFHWERAAAATHAGAPFLERAKQATSRMAQEQATESRRPDLAQQIPGRPEAAPARLADLSAHYNALLTETWLPAQGLTTANDLSALPVGLQKFAGVEYDVRGIIQLSSAALENSGGRFPREVPGIQIGRPSRRLHFLHGAAWTALFGTHVGSYIVRYANGESQEIKIVFGQNVREWWYSPTQPQMTASASVAWEGSNAASSALGMKVRLYQMAWINPLPKEPIVSIDFRSTMQNAAPFLVALTLE